MEKTKLASIFVGAFCVAFAIAIGANGRILLSTIAFMVLPYAGIWLPEALATSRWWFGKSPETLPARVVSVLGWFLLLATPFVTYAAHLRHELLESIGR